MPTIQSQGKERNYILYVPPSYDGKTPVPLVMDLHGAMANATSAENGSGMKALADSENYVYVAPNGLNMVWAAEDDSDELFLRDVVEALSETGCLDRRRVYATGCSNGAFLATWLACHAADMFAAASPWCGTSFIDTATECMPSRPVPVILMLGETDPLACWEGERSDVLAMTPCARKFQKDFVKVNECTGQPQPTHDGVCETVSQCKADVEVVICKANTSHVVYNATNIDPARATWDFFKKFQKP